ncbi:DegT/DnrJ/EryC1/StrS family aminotransferase [Azospirillum sp. ST 5-10]|uniref:DegT/DnrJ/EryC1/StrS family aminotransferase n=1 Tax=unclassified Azospirillum TaxID=2630922 RepID=UPI003F4A67E1
MTDSTWEALAGPAVLAAEPVLAGRARSVLAAIIDELFGDQPFTAIIPEASCTSLFAAVWRPGASMCLAPPDPVYGVAPARAYREVALAARPPGIIVLTHSFGYRVADDRDVRDCLDAGWHVVENDPCSLGVLDPAGISRHGLGIVFSFGAGKVIDAGVGGAFLARDESFARRLRWRIATYPPVDQRALDVESYLVGLRRQLWYGHPTGRSLLGCWRAFLTEEQAEIRYRLPDGTAAIDAALDRAKTVAATRAMFAARWRDSLQAAAIPHLTLPQREPAAWWRFNILFGRGRAEALQHWLGAGLRVGRLYPSLAAYFPDLLPEGPSPACVSWAERVVNLPVDGSASLSDIDRAVFLLSRCMGG